MDFPIKHCDFPWQNVSSPEGSSPHRNRFLDISLQELLVCCSTAGVSCKFSHHPILWSKQQVQFPLRPQLRFLHLRPLQRGVVRLPGAHAAQRLRPGGAGQGVSSVQPWKNGGELWLWWWVMVVNYISICLIYNIYLYIYIYLQQWEFQDPKMNIYINGNSRILKWRYVSTI